jgi:hypothetical protein
MLLWQDASKDATGKVASWRCEQEVDGDYRGEFRRIDGGTRWVKRGKAVILGGRRPGTI